ncbi:ABC transporter transmembrane domain-containing protein [Roseomonas elaeocarpi]|uniref:ABC transporter transmembrane domain-containing protein n=1 Tax=Roseomonas elaeocarpi TaxID=907779 RepID=A0ABV6JUT9_9PROT
MPGANPEHPPEGGSSADRGGHSPLAANRSGATFPIFSQGTAASGSVAPSRRPALSALRLLPPFLRPYRWQAIGALVAMLVAALSVLGLGQGVRYLIDHGFAGGAGRLDTAALAMFAVVTVLALATFARFTLVSTLGERVAADLRRAVFSHVLTLSPAWFEAMRTGDILTRLTADTAVLQSLAGSAISTWLRNAFLLLGAFAMLVATSPRLAALVVAVVPVVVVPVVMFSRRERRLSRLAQDRVADLGAYAEETINALRTVQAFTHEPIDRAGFAAAAGRSVAAATARIRTRGAQLLVVILLGFGAITLSLWVGGRDVLAGRMTGGELSAFVFYAVVVANAGASLSELWGEVQRAAGAADRIGELLRERPAITAPPQPDTLPEPPLGRVEFRDVVFRYPARPDHPALRGVSLRVEPGETVAVVGPSGAGKSTLFSLLLRFYEPQSGRILVDGVAVDRLDPAALRRRVGLVSQDPVVFGADAWTNLRYGRPEASDSEVLRAVEAASAGFLHELPQGLGTFLGEKGVRLSGGQRQRLAIARAMLRDAPILLLDEATSALDAESERAVQDALERLSQGRTTLVVAHRLATVRRADRILVLEDGVIVASGRHDELASQPGLYARLAELQFGRSR